MKTFCLPIRHLATILGLRISDICNYKIRKKERIRKLETITLPITHIFIFNLPVILRSESKHKQAKFKPLSIADDFQPSSSSNRNE